MDYNSTTEAHSLQPIFGEGIDSDSRIELPVLYLTLLSDFLGKVSSEEISSHFSPAQYYPLLYGTSNHANPLGVCDPLNIIRNFIGTLEML